jgi:2-aminoadipate transaminase
MEFNVVNRIKSVQGSAIRQMFKLAQGDIISFGGGNPATEAFPADDIQRIVADVLQKKPVSMLQYGLSEGYPPLVATLKDRLAKTENMDFEKNDVLIVSGGQQAASLLCALLVDEGDVIITEDPSFVGCLNCFRCAGARLVGVPLEPDGMDITRLEEALKKNKKVSFIYTIPSFQNPTGYTTSLEKRKKIYELAQKYNTVILEDNPYGELRFSGDPIPTIKSMDTDGRVVYAGSFSKVVAPAVRVGYMVFDKSLMSHATIAKQAQDVHTNKFRLSRAHRAHP